MPAFTAHLLSEARTVSDQQGKRKGDRGTRESRAEGSAGGRRAAYASWFIWLRKSLLVLVSRSLSSRSSIASTGFNWLSAFRRSHTFWSSSFSNKSSSFLVPVCSMLIVG